MNLSTSEEVATILGVEYATLRKRLSNHPELQPAKKFGRSWVWTDEEVEALRKKEA